MTVTIKEALMRAFVAGWQDAKAGAVNDDYKHEVAEDLAALVQASEAAAPRLYEALRKIADEPCEHPGFCCHQIARTAIANVEADTSRMARLTAACKSLLVENGELRQMLADRTGITHTVHAAREEAIAALADVESGPDGRTVVDHPTACPYCSGGMSIREIGSVRRWVCDACHAEFAPAGGVQ